MILTICAGDGFLNLVHENYYTMPELTRELGLIERKFDRLQRKRAPSFVLLRLSQRTQMKVEARQVAKESQAHASQTMEMLRLIDEYAKKHLRIRENREPIQLPKSMRVELEHLSLRKRVDIHPGLPKQLKRAPSSWKKTLPCNSKKPGRIPIRSSLRQRKSVKKPGTNCWFAPIRKSPACRKKPRPPSPRKRSK